jgi:hypothetical protein
MTRVAIVLAVLVGLPPTAVHAQGLTLSVTSNETLYYPGDRLDLSISAANTGGASTLADFYTGVILPDGATIATVGPGGAPSIGSLANVAGFVPVARAVSLSGAFSASVDPLFRYVWTGNEPLGNYTIFLVAVRAGGFADNRIDGGDILGVRMGQLSLRRPATFTLDPGAPISVAMTAAEGGTLTATSAAGISYTLTVPPNALPEDLTISASPVAAATGLPITAMLGSIRFAPDGLRLLAPATLAVTLPSTPPPGLVGFTSKDNGTGFETAPVTVSNTTVTLRVAHFSTPGIGTDLCGSGVTSAVGIDACREMAEALQRATEIILRGAGSTEPAVRQALANEIRRELQVWIPAIMDLVNGGGSTVPADQHYYFRVGVRELNAVQAVAQLLAGLDLGPVVITGLDDAEQLLAFVLPTRRDVANQQCLADKPNYRTWIQRLVELATIAHERSLPVDATTHGITCVRLTVSINFPLVVPPEGAPFVGDASIKFSDGALLPNPQPIVTIEVKEDGLATLASPTLAQAPGTANLSTTIGPNPGRPEITKFQIRVSDSDLGFVRVNTIQRGHAVVLRSRGIDYEHHLRAGPAAKDLSLPNQVSFGLDEEVESPNSIAEASSSTRGSLSFLNNNQRILVSGESSVQAEGTNTRVTETASARTTVASRVVVDLVGTFDCRFALITAASADDGATIAFHVRVTRDGVTMFEPTVTTTTNAVCQAGRYEIEVDVNGEAVSSNSSTDAFANREYDFELILTPQIVPIPSRR